MLDNKFLGLPLVLWLVMVGTALFVDVPMVLLNSTTQHRLNEVESTTLNTQTTVTRLATEPTATPSALVTSTPIPTVRVVVPSKKTTVLPVKPGVTTQVK